MRHCLPDALWRSPLVLECMGRMAGPVLAGGVDARMSLQGRVPNGQHFQATPRHVWRLSATHACIYGADAGPVGRLREQVHLEDVWLPQTGLFFAGQMRFLAPRAA